MMTRNEVAALIGTEPVTHENAHHWVKLNQEQVDASIDRALLFQRLASEGGQPAAGYKRMFEIWLGRVKCGMQPRGSML